jgi:hypothetical protein
MTANVTNFPHKFERRMTGIAVDLPWSQISFNWIVRYFYYQATAIRK